MFVVGRFNIRILTGQTRPAPSLSQTLGGLGLNMMVFNKEFQARTSTVRKNVNVQVRLIVYQDKTYKFYLRSPAASWFLKRTARVHTGKGPLPEVMGNVRLKEIFHIAKAKSCDPEYIGVPLKQICQSLMGSARSLGLKVVDDQLDAQFKNRDDVQPVDLDRLKREARLARKNAGRRGK